MKCIRCNGSGRDPKDGQYCKRCDGTGKEDLVSAIFAIAILALTIYFIS